MSFFDAFRQVKTLAFDMDGVLTDGRILVEAAGEWVRSMDIKDGYALQLAAKMGFDVIVISGSTSVPVRERLHRLGIRDVFMGVKNKEEELAGILAAKERKWSETLFMGDDMPDFACMRAAGMPVCPADACTDIKSIAFYISPCRGGYGCVRDVIEKVLKLNDKWPLLNDVSSI